MPALHRMPVVYVVLFLAALGVMLSRVTKRDHIKASPVATSDQPSVRPKIEAPSVTATPPRDPILRTDRGVRRKVMIQTLGADARPDPNRRDAGIPLDYLSIAFVYGEQPGFVQVGPATGPPLGWVESGSVLEWDTRLMARPLPRANRPPLIIYADRRCLLDRLDGRVCPRHEGRCPTEGEESGDANDAPIPALGLPILSSESIPQPDGTFRTIHEVASPVRDRAAPAVVKEPPREMLPLLKTVYLAVVIDTTASMEASIVAVREFAANLVANATNRYEDVNLRLALVEYRDRSPVFGFRTRRVTDFTTPERFLEALDRIAPATEGDGSVDEAVLDGVEAALPPFPQGEPGLIHVTWPRGRPGVLASKMLVLVGDAPDHDQDLQRVHRLAEVARNSGIVLATVRLDRPGALSREEMRRYREQWHNLAALAFLPRDSSQAFAEPIAPIEIDLTDQGALTNRLQAVLDERVQQARELAALAVAEAEGKLVEYTNRHGIAVDRLLPVLSDLHRGEDTPTSRPDPRHEGRKAPSLRKGWIAERVGQTPLVELEVLMSRPELDAIIDELTGFEQATVGNSESLEDLLRIGTAAIAGESAFLAMDRGEQTFAEHLRSREGLPPARPDSLLLRTQTDLLQADEATRAALDARLRSVLRKMIERRNADDWDDPRRTVEGMAGIPYDWLDW